MTPTAGGQPKRIQWNQRTRKSQSNNLDDEEAFADIDVTAANRAIVTHVICLVSRATLTSQYKLVGDCAHGTFEACIVSYLTLNSLLD